MTNEERTAIMTVTGTRIVLAHKARERYNEVTRQLAEPRSSIPVTDETSYLLGRADELEWLLSIVEDQIPEPE